MGAGWKPINRKQTGPAAEPVAVRGPRPTVMGAVMAGGLPAPLTGGGRPTVLKDRCIRNLVASSL